MPNTARWGRADHVSRNVAITAVVLNGTRCQDAAKEHGLTTERARQVTAKCCRLANKTMYDKMPECKTTDIRWLRDNKEHFLPQLPA